jgi:hypothetical protein
MLFVPMLAACGGGIGLAPGVISETESPMTMADGLTGRTYAAWLTEVVAVEPMGLGIALADVDAAALLLHVVDSSEDGMAMAITLSDGEGFQSACEPVSELPAADWATSDDVALDFSIDEGSFALPVGGKLMTLSGLSMDGAIIDDGTAMETTTLAAEIDTRDLNGGAFGDDVDVCIIVEQLGSTCYPCPDGEEACTDLVLELAPVEVDVDFDPSISGC